MHHSCLHFIKYTYVNISRYNWWCACDIKGPFPLFLSFSFSHSSITLNCLSILFRLSWEFCTFLEARFLKFYPSSKSSRFHQKKLKRAHKLVLNAPRNRREKVPKKLKLILFISFSFSWNKFWNGGKVDPKNTDNNNTEIAKNPYVDYSKLSPEDLQAQRDWDALVAQFRAAGKFHFLHLFSGLLVPNRTTILPVRESISRWNFLSHSTQILGGFISDKIAPRYMPHMGGKGLFAIADISVYLSFSHLVHIDMSCPHRIALAKGGYSNFSERVVFHS